MKAALKELSNAPADQIDPSIIPRFENVQSAADMKAILDECAHSALASDFAMQAMDLVWRLMIKEEQSNDPPH